MKDDLKELMRHNYLQYASYVILERAIPDVVDGLKPVQRRILYALHKIDDGKLHKVANVVGQTMAYHPHGDAPIYEALVNVASKGYLLDRQGNFGNLYTGDPAAASRYIETRLSKLAKKTLFNPQLTQFIPSYDSRSQEPVCLPAKIPVLLMHGVDGIAVGMSTRILPHNFTELLQAEIAIIEGRDFVLYPDFPTGGIVDATEYNAGVGKAKLRAKLRIKDDKTIVIDEICYGTTTESLIKSIEEAAKKGQIKIDSIHDYTAEKVEIEITLPRGQHAEGGILEALYAFTECQVTLHSQVIVVKDNMPWETDVHQILRLHAEKLQGYLHQELEIERHAILEKMFEKSLEEIFIENRLYKQLENVSTNDAIHTTLSKSLEPYASKLIRRPTFEDREKLLSIPIRRISKFDLERNKKEVAELKLRLEEVEKNLKQIKKFTIRYLQDLIKEFGKEFPRKTVVKAIEDVDKRVVATKKVKVGFDPKTGFIGLHVDSETKLECTNFDKLLLLYADGTYKVIPIPDKLYVHQNDNLVVYAGIADKETIIRVVYKDQKTHQAFAKRFVVDKFIMEKTYRYLEEGMHLEYLTTRANVKVRLNYKPQERQKITEEEFLLDEILVKGVSAKGIRLSTKPVKKIYGPSAKAS